ncbi:VapE domain-containing protein [Methylobacterium sp. WL8]|uniref:VapE domain-containing protein n=1 Tax=Methylobacterium sp. WL8 TaxID=2603899 RepID=UPI0011CC59E3|nr:VapE domain-containing protein [Methylobacterium sp. WL8]TXN81267.1 DnaJ domain-containing protein [Methylobacterium sp. WL8]
MTRGEAYVVLGLAPSATVDEIKAAHRREAKATHPDHNGAHRAADFIRVGQARDTLLGHQLRPGERTEKDRTEETEDEFDDEGFDPISIVRQFMAHEQIEVLFDGTIRVGTGPRMAYGPADVDSWLASTPVMSIKQLHTLVMLDVRRAGIKLGSDDIHRAIAKIIWDDQQDRRNRIMRPFVENTPDPAVVARAAVVWTRLVATTLAIDVALGVAVLQHFIWQVKQKLLNRPVHHHMMPIVISPVQGTGKSTLVGLFLGPLHELASDPVALSDFADTRSSDLYRFPVVFIDDIDPIGRTAVPTLKRLMTSKAVRGRTLGTSNSDRRPQLSTLIGTANESVSALIADPTGHRRFFGLPFRNGAAQKGGDSAIWQVINETDYDLLWRSVDTFGPAPIIPFLDALAAVQSAQAPCDPLRDWLCTQDFLSEPFADLCERWGLKADALRQRYNAEGGETLNNNRFKDRMADLVLDPAVPLGPSVRNKDGTFYPLKLRRSSCEGQPAGDP